MEDREDRQKSRLSPWLSIWEALATLSNSASMPGASASQFDVGVLFIHERPHQVITTRSIQHDRTVINGVLPAEMGDGVVRWLGLFEDIHDDV